MDRQELVQKLRSCLASVWQKEERKAKPALGCFRKRKCTGQLDVLKVKKKNGDDGEMVEK